MREIKVRAWDIKNNIWHENFGGIFPWGTREGERNVIHIGIMPLHFVFEQYTGIKDANGKEIYEGDILSNNETQLDEHGFPQKMLRVVKWNKDGWWSPFNEIVDFDGVTWAPNEKFEIVGNMHENPELMELVSIKFWRHGNY